MAWLNGKDNWFDCMGCDAIECVDCPFEHKSCFDKDVVLYFKETL